MSPRQGSETIGWPALREVRAERLYIFTRGALVSINPHFVLVQSYKLVFSGAQNHSERHVEDTAVVEGAYNVRLPGNLIVGPEAPPSDFSIYCQRNHLRRTAT